MLEDEIKRGPPETPIAQKTKLRWVLSGPISYANRERSTETAVYGFQCLLDLELLDVLQPF